MISMVLALKDLASAKSRFVDTPDELRRQLAWAMFCDTVVTCSEVADRILVVTDVPGVLDHVSLGSAEVSVLPDPGGLNAAFRAGAAAAGPHDQVGAVMSDLPALSTAELRGIVAAAAEHHRSFVPDADDRGTTMLFARGVPLDPRFDDGPHQDGSITMGSAQRHYSSGAQRLTTHDPASWAGARRDVDDLASLRQAIELGPGPRTRALLQESAIWSVLTGAPRDPGAGG